MLCFSYFFRRKMTRVSREKNRRDSLFEKPKINIDFENRMPEFWSYHFPGPLAALEPPWIGHRNLLKNVKKMRINNK